MHDTNITYTIHPLIISIQFDKAIFVGKVNIIGQGMVFVIQKPSTIHLLITVSCN